MGQGQLNTVLFESANGFYRVEDRIGDADRH